MRVVGIHRPATVSGVSASGVRLAALPEPFTPWRPLVIGETPDGDPAGLLERSPLRDAPGVAACAWGPGADVPTRLSLMRASLREMRAEVVVPNDLPEGFAAAALEPEMAIAAWYHADHHDGDELLLRCGELADAWRAVIADRIEAERRTRQAFAAALIDALLKADERDAMLRALLRTMPLKERHARRGITLKWIPDGAGGLLRVETALPMAGD